MKFTSLQIDGVPQKFPGISATAFTTFQVAEGFAFEIKGERVEVTHRESQHVVNFPLTRCTFVGPKDAPKEKK